MSVRTGKTEQLSFGEKTFGGELTFVPKADAKEEEDGYLVGYINEERISQDGKDVSFFIAVNAREMKIVCKIRLPGRVPYGFHGIWLSENDIKNQIPVDVLDEEEKLADLKKSFFGLAPRLGRFLGDILG